MKKILMFVVFILVVSLSVNVFAASVPYMGKGKWSSYKVNFALYSDIPSSYVNPIQWGADIWTDNTDFKLVRNSSSKINVCAYKYGFVGWDGMSFMNGSNFYPWDNAYSYGAIHLNRTYADSYDNVRKKLVACHEFGHMASLWHSSDFIMMYGSDVWTAYQNNKALRYKPDACEITALNNRY